MQNNQKIIGIFGAGGFIGGHLVSSLLDEGHEVVCADIKPTEFWFQYFNECENFSLDLKSYNNCLKVTKNVDFIYNICLLYTSPSPRDVEESGLPACG